MLNLYIGNELKDIERVVSAQNPGAEPLIYNAYILLDSLSSAAFGFGVEFYENKGVGQYDPIANLIKGLLEFINEFREKERLYLSVEDMQYIYELLAMPKPRESERSSTGVYFSRNDPARKVIRRPVSKPPTTNNNSLPSQEQHQTSESSYIRVDLSNPIDKNRPKLLLNN